MSSTKNNFQNFLRVITIFMLLANVLGASGASVVYAASLTVNSTADAVDANPGDGLCATAGGQ